MLLKKTAELLKPKEIQALLLASEILADEPILTDKISRVLSISTDEVHKALAELIKFIYLSAYYEMSLTPSPKVDLVWHEFILFTRTYAQFCQKHFQRFIHHQPDDDVNNNNINQILGHILCSTIVCLI